MAVTSLAAVVPYIAVVIAWISIPALGIPRGGWPAGHALHHHGSRLTDEDGHHVTAASSRHRWQYELLDQIRRSFSRHGTSDRHLMQLSEAGHHNRQQQAARHGAQQLQHLAQERTVPNQTHAGAAGAAGRRHDVQSMDLPSLARLQQPSHTQHLQASLAGIQQLQQQQLSKLLQQRQHVGTISTTQHDLAMARQRMKEQLVALANKRAAKIAAQRSSRGTLVELAIRTGGRGTQEPRLVTRNRVVEKAAIHVPIDVVYTFVNATDPAWQARYMSALNVSEIKDTLRFASYGEILLSVAGVWQMAPWVRTIWVVSQNQSFDTSLFVPELAARIKFVDHTAFIPAELLPTFNSNAIEAFLHRIPGLSDTFLYLNDDIFPVCPLTRTHLFVGNKPSAWARLEHMDPPPASLGADWWHAVWNARILVASRSGLMPYVHWHAGHLLTRAAFEAAWSMFPAALTQTASNRVRVYKPLDQGGDVAIPMLIVSTALAKGFQQLNLQNMWVPWWDGKVVLNSSVYTAPSWQNGCVQRVEGKPAMFLNLQDLNNEVQGKLWCDRSYREYGDAFAKHVGTCFCASMPMGSACSTRGQGVMGIPNLTGNGTRGDSLASGTTVVP